MDEFAPYYKRHGCFIVKNITSDRNKTIKIFNNPILFNTTRDILQIPGVAEADIRASLLKGELRHKILARDIIIECSDIDLLQFNDDQRQFLLDAGIINGLQVSANNIDVLRKEDIVLNGLVNDSNTVFTTDSIFIQNTTYKIIVYKNGVKQLFLDDYFIAESGGPGSGYDTVILTVAPTTIPTPVDVITADYYIANI